MIPRISPPVSRRSLTESPRLEQGLVLSACGSGWTERLVPNRWGNANFTPACRNHDDCYDTCGKSQAACDSQFASDLQRICRRAYNSPWHVLQRRACQGVAVTYAAAVMAAGAPFYIAAQRAQRCPRPIPSLPR